MPISFHHQPRPLTVSGPMPLRSRREEGRRGLSRLGAGADLALDHTSPHSPALREGEAAL